jgi:hypothetical protein
LYPVAVTLTANTLTANTPELTLNKSDWQDATHFSKEPFESGWRYAIHGEWQQLTSGIVEREERVDCEAYGFCTKNAIILECPQGRFIEGSAGYYEQMGNDDCFHSSGIESGQFSNCPGKQQVKIRSRSEQNQLTLRFTEPDSDATLEKGVTHKSFGVNRAQKNGVLSPLSRFSLINVVMSCNRFLPCRARQNDVLQSPIRIKAVDAACAV